MGKSQKILEENFLVFISFKKPTNIFFLIFFPNDLNESNFFWCEIVLFMVKMRTRHFSSETSWPLLWPSVLVQSLMSKNSMNRLSKFQILHMFHTCGAGFELSNYFELGLKNIKCWNLLWTIFILTLFETSFSCLKWYVSNSRLFWRGGFITLQY